MWFDVVVKQLRCFGQDCSLKEKILSLAADWSSLSNPDGSQNIEKGYNWP